MRLICNTVIASLVVSAAATSITTRRLRPITPALNIPEDFQLTWSQYSPYFPIVPYPEVPLGCQIDQVNSLVFLLDSSFGADELSLDRLTSYVALGCQLPAAEEANEMLSQLQRHGARFPTSGAGKQIQSAVNKLLAVPEFKDHRLDFLHSFQYDLGADVLVPFGAAQYVPHLVLRCLPLNDRAGRSYDAGAEAFERYSHLVSAHNLPFVRASSSERVVVSAQNWTQGTSGFGFFLIRWKLTPP